MKNEKQIIKHSLFVLFISSIMLVSCGGGGGNNELFNNSNKHTNTADSQGKSSENVGKNSSHDAENNSVNNSNTASSDVLDQTAYTDFEFSYGSYLQQSGTASVKLKDGCTTANIIVPAKVSINGGVYLVVDDNKQPGLGYNMSVQTITLPEGFKKLVIGFNADMNLKKVYLPSTMEQFDGYLFTSCTSFESIEYNGTKSQWEAIEKDDYWNYLAKEIKVNCKDGTIIIPAWE